jgi:hypothetical protein
MFQEISFLYESHALIVYLFFALAIKNAGFHITN